MSFAVVCKSCHARFLLNDDLLRRKVAGKVVTVRCRQCHATIEVDASDVDPESLPRLEQSSGATAKLLPKGPKPAPPPPRPTAKSTLMGIGAPTKPGTVKELVALSAGFLDVRASTATTPATPHGFPEPPPPPGVVEELTSGDWEVAAETPPLEASEVSPESIDDFVEELPSSAPPPSDEEVPSSSGIPSLKALTHHDEQARPKRADEFLANITAAMNGGIMPETAGAPTIDISTLGEARAETSNAPSIDVSALDVPLAGKSTLPLFAPQTEPNSPAPSRPRSSKGPPRLPDSGAPSAAPAARERQEPEANQPDSAGERKHVAASATKSTSPAATGQRRSGLGAPVLIVLAVAAAFLIWKRNSLHSNAAAREPVHAAAPSPNPPPPTPPTPPAPEAPPASETPAAPTPAQAVASGTAPANPMQAAAIVQTPTKLEPSPASAHDKPAAPSEAASPTAPAKSAEKAPTSEPTPATPKPEEPAPVAVEEPAPPQPPAGPFDRAAAAAALNTSASQASACRKDGDPSGIASVVITFAPSGRVTSANVSGPPFAGTPTGGCIAAALRKTKVPPFDGDRVTVSKTITIQ